ncbi:MAG: 50S ribosomal protein L7/L12 [Candidatus Liptonbacteria bacterium]|nr:50S ribosomal protein L7/L12 [Candidatus Liptonbacteria bacterium]
MKKEDIMSAVEKMSVLELSELVKALEEKFGVSAAMPMAVAAAPAGGDEGGAKEEQTSFTVELKATGDQKINVIKALREVTTLGLKEAKDLADAAPKTVKEGVTKEEAAEIKKKLEAAGAQVEIK